MVSLNNEIAERIIQAMLLDEPSPSPLDMDIIIPKETHDFIEEFHKNKIKLEQICKSMEQVLEKWDVKIRPASAAPSLDARLTYPHKCAEQLGKIQKLPFTDDIDEVNEVLIATQVAYSDLATLEREHLVKLYKTVIEKIFKGYLVNEVPGIERNIKSTNEAALALGRAIEVVELKPTPINKEYLSKAESNFSFALVKMDQYVRSFPDRQKEFARGANLFAQGLREHYVRLHRSMNATLELLDKKLASHRNEQEEEGGAVQGEEGAEGEGGEVEEVEGGDEGQ
uniref:Uncharacterized protein n=1 Tax=Meloidogyne enterolobii TaxID=390850 RepID=A0A6V7XNC2_MELEN|nr:unnamed protein product [Meloidogyne enterolobii]